MSKEKQIEEMVKIITGYEDCGNCKNCNFHGCCSEERIATNLYEAGFRKQSGEHEKRIVNQREELRRLNKRINDLTQSRDVWKKRAERVGKQLHEVLSKQSKGKWEE